MGFDDEQCPDRGPGLRHRIVSGLVCDVCGKEKTEGFTLADWLRAFRTGPVAPRVVKVSGEKPPDCEDDEKDRVPDGFWTKLTERERHALLVERRYHESHECDDR